MPELQGEAGAGNREWRLHGAQGPAVATALPDAGLPPRAAEGPRQGEARAHSGHAQHLWGGDG